MGFWDKAKERAGAFVEDIESLGSKSSRELIGEWRRESNPVRKSAILKELSTRDDVNVDDLKR